MKRIRLALAVLVVGVIAIAAIYFEYYVWEQQHPNAPFWTYFFKD